jgi:hypothetical protein
VRSHVIVLKNYVLFRTSSFGRAKNQFDRMAFLVISIKAGVGHLTEIFTILPRDEFEIGQEALEEHRLPDIIRSSANILVDVKTKTKDVELQMHLDVQDSKFTELTRASREILQNRRPMTHGAADGRPLLNQTIALRPTKGLSALLNYDESETDFGGFDAAEEISRDGVKKASSNIIAVEERRKLRSIKPEYS